MSGWIFSIYEQKNNFVIYKQKVKFEIIIDNIFIFFYHFMRFIAYFSIVTRKKKTFKFR